MKDFPISDHASIMETLILQIRDLLTKIKTNEFRQHGITIQQFAVLDILSIIGDNVTPSELSRKLLRQPHTVSRLLIRMEKKGLVKRTKNPELKTNLNIALTPKGRQLLNKVKSMDSTREIKSSLSEKEFQQLIMSLKKIRNSALDKLTQRNSYLLP